MTKLGRLVNDGKIAGLEAPGFPLKVFGFRVWRLGFRV